MVRYVVAMAVTAAVACAAGAEAQERLPAQGSAVVLGTVVSEGSGEPVPSTQVELLTGDSVRVASAAADGQGRFRLEDVPEGTFLLRLSSIGYGTVRTEPFEVAEAEERNLGRLVLPIQAVAVDPITVSTERTAVTYEADRTSYNVGVMPGTEGASVTETLATIPELEVDIDGNVRFRNSGVAIYINGRPAPMSGEALSIFLEQFPADYLQKIELLDNPSARYDAEGGGGIVNLVMKEGVELGLSGSVFANAGTRGQYGVGGRGTLQRGEWTVNGGGFLRLSDQESTSYDLRENLFVDPAFLRQDSWSDRSRLASNVDLEMRYEPTERARLYAEGRTSFSGGESEGLTTTTHLDELESTILLYDRARASDSRDVSWDFAAGFDYEWEPREHELEIELEVERGRQRDDSREERTGEGELEDGALIPADLTLEEERELEDQVSLGVDYARPWGERGGIEVGWDVDWSKNDRDRLIRLIEDPDGVRDETVTDRGYAQRETRQSVYTTLQRRMGDVSLQVGLRMEHLDRRFELPDAEPFERQYTDLFPSANLSWRMDDQRSLRASYSRRTRRPGVSVLNPVNTSTDPLNRSVGNPDIDPSFVHSFSLNARWSLSTGSLRLSPYYRRTTNEWARITTVDDQGVSTRTYENVASGERYGASLTYSLRRRDGWGGNVSVAASREVRDASNLAERYSGTSLRLSSRANVNGRLTEDLSVQANLSYSPPTDLPQGRSDARYRADLGLRYQLLDDRGSVRLSLRDPFGLQRSSSQLRDVDYILIGRSRESTRSAQVSVSWALGGGGEFRGGRGRGRR